MSFTEDIALLVSRTNALLTTFDGKAAAISAAVAAALAAAPAATKIVYVDPVGGNDASVGSLAAPVLTIDRALDMVAAFRVATIRLLGNVTMATRHYFDGNCLMFEGIARDASNVEGFVRLTRTITVQAAGGDFFGKPTTAGVGLNSVCALGLYNIAMALPSVPNTYQDNLRLTFWFGVSGYLSLRYASITAAAGTYARLAGSFSGTERITVAAQSFTIDSSATGKVLTGVAAGADPNAQWIYDSNLTSV